MEAKIYFAVKIACLLFIFYHLWKFIFNRQMYGVWNRFYHLMRIVRIKLWRYQKKRMAEKARNARYKARKNKAKERISKPDNKIKDTVQEVKIEMPTQSQVNDNDVIGKTKIVYLEDPEVARKTPTRSEPLPKEPIEEDEDISPDDVMQENRGLTK